jgi:redox-sensitive bicupin YhaK (pirin superfamily)
MIALRRSEERKYEQAHKRETWRSFATLVLEPQDAGFGALEALDEERLAPGARVALHADGPVEIVTYVLTGTIAHEDATGRSALLQAGEFQCITASHGLRHAQTNASRHEHARLFRARLRSPEATAANRVEQRRFSTAQRRGALCLIAAPDARHGALRVQQAASIYAALLDPGQHIVHELAADRCGWLHVVSGSVRFSAFVLNAGDAVGVTGERSMSLTALQSAEILLFDSIDPRPHRSDQRAL